MSRLGQFYASKKRPLRLLGYLAAPLVYWATGSLWYALLAAVLAVWGIDRLVLSRLHYRIRLFETGGFSELPVRMKGGHRSIVLELAFSPSGDFLASSGIDGTVRLWEVGTGRLRQMWRGHEGYARGVCFSPDGGCILSHGRREILLHDVASGERIRALAMADGESCAQALISADGTRIAAVMEEAPDGLPRHRLRFFDLEGTPLPEGVDGFGLFAFSPDGSVFGCEPGEGEEGEIAFWSCDDGSRIGSIRLPPALVREPPGSRSFSARLLYLSQGGRWAILADTRGGHHILDASTGELRDTLTLAEVDYPVRALLSADSRYLVVSKGSGYQYQFVLAYDIQDGALKARIDSVKSEWGVPFTLSADGGTLATAGEDQM